MLLLDMNRIGRFTSMFLRFTKEQFKLNETETLIILRLKEAQDNQGNAYTSTRPTDLARSIPCSKSTLTSQMAQLIERHLIETIYTKADGSAAANGRHSYRLTKNGVGLATSISDELIPHERLLRSIIHKKTQLELPTFSKYILNWCVNHHIETPSELKHALMSNSIQKPKRKG